MARVAWGVWEHAPPPRKFWNLETQKCSFKHFPWHFPSEKSILGQNEDEGIASSCLMLATALRICRIFSRLSSTNGITVFKYVIWDQFSRRSNLMYVVVWSLYLFKYLDSRFDQKLWPNAPERYSCFMYFKCQCLRPVMAAKRLIVVYS